MNIFESKKSYINWVVDNYHVGVVNNAISAGLIVSDIPREELYYVLCNAMESGGMNQVMYSLDVPLNLSSQSDDVRGQFARAVGPQKMMNNQIPDFCDSGFTGPLSPEQQNAVASGACETGGFWGEDGFTLGDLGAILNTAAGVFGAIWGAVGTRPDNTGSGGNNEPIDAPKDNTNMILIVAAIVMVVVLVVLLTRRK